MAQHRLDPTPATTRDFFSRDVPPVLTIDPGDSVVVSSLDASGFLTKQMTPGEQQPTMFGPFKGHCLTGPIAVRGAEPGMVLALHLDALTPDDWGWTSSAMFKTPSNERLGVGDAPQTWLLWDLDVHKEAGSNQLGFSAALAPFLGVMGVAPDEPGELSTIPPRAEGGGNIDCKELVAGSTLYLPVQVPGALLSLGDGHAAQGDGEVCGTAIECPMTTEVTVELMTDVPVPGIHAVTPTARITFGFSSDLNAAMGDALAAMLTWMEQLYGLTRAECLALASTGVDLRVTQVVNEVWGVHAVLANDAWL